MSKRWLVTCGLDYANGPMHLGHLLEKVQADIFVRALRMCGDEVLFICGADSHGTPIELSAHKEGLPPQQVAQRWREAAKASFAPFDIGFDGDYGTTHCAAHERQVREVFARLQRTGHVVARPREQLFDPVQGRFLPDRLVRGTCPRCGQTDQYGDGCEACGATYAPTELKDARSAFSGSPPVVKSSEHLFFQLRPYAPRLRRWVTEGGVPRQLRAFVLGWIDEGLRDWDISRDAPYFGIAIPDHPGKFFYVWLDAPIGYMTPCEGPQAALLFPHKVRRSAPILCGDPLPPEASVESKHSEGAVPPFCRPRAGGDPGDQNVRDASTSFVGAEGLSKRKGAMPPWEDPECNIVHFIGKDIVAFHALFWPAVLLGAGYQLPKQLAVHGMLTVNGGKMSKSRGTFITADAFARQVDPQALRYYLASKSGGGVEDMDLALPDLLAKVNGELVGGVVNLMSRTVALLHRHCDGKLARLDSSAQAHALRQAARDLVPAVRQAYRARETARAIKHVQAFAHQANVYLQQTTPWHGVKENPALAHRQLTMGLWASKVAVGLLAPVVPRMARQVEGMLRLEHPLTFANVTEGFTPDQRLGPYERLCERVQQRRIDALLDQTNARSALVCGGSTPLSMPRLESKRSQATAIQNSSNKKEKKMETNMISIDRFAAVDLRVAYVARAHAVEGSDKLIALVLDVGPLGQRQVLTGLRPHVTPEDLQGKMLALVSNLKPRKMRFGVSEGMVLACGDDKPQPVFVMGNPGDRIR
ncbi:MAG: methionine--tRNA ligase [Myxococcota bacterium]